MKQLRVFFAGKIDPSSNYARAQWREDLIADLNARLTSKRAIDTSFIYPRNSFIIDNHLPVSVLFAQSCYYLKYADVCVVNLTDDISVGGSQEILLAKMLGVPVVALAPRNGKFNKLRYELGGKTYWNWVHPFAGALCNVMVQDVDELATALDDIEHIPSAGVNSVNEAIAYYEERASALDTTLNRILSFQGEPASFKPKLRVYFAGKMGKASHFSETNWRDQLAAIISQNSRFKSVNLDFLEVTHAAINENDPKMMFGRDAYLIRSADLVVVNLSDDISIGGSIEMMLAKLYHRPLIGIARRGGKFVAEEREILGRKLTNYVNPFVTATCDWLVHNPTELPKAVNQLFTRPVKNASIVPASLRWYKERLAPIDRSAQKLAALAAH